VADKSEVSAEETRAKAAEKKAQEEAEGNSDPKGSATMAKGEAEVAATSKADAAEEGAITAASSKVTTEEEARKAEVKTEKERAEAAEALKIPLSQKGKASGVAELNGEGRLLEGELPNPVASISLTAIVVGGEQYAGTDAGFAAAIEAAKASLKPIWVLPGEYTLTKSLPLFSGLSMLGNPLGSTDLKTRVLIKNATESIFKYPEGASGTITDIEIAGILFEGSGSLQNTWFIEEQSTAGSEWVLTDARITRCGFSFFRNILKGSFLRLSLFENYINNTSGAPLIVHGSDSYIEKNYIQSPLIGNTASVPAYAEAKTYVANQFVKYEGRYFRASGSVAAKQEPPKAAESNGHWIYLPEAAPMFLVQYAMAQTTFGENYLSPCPGPGVAFVDNYAGSQIINNKINCTVAVGAAVTESGGRYGGSDGPGLYFQFVEASTEFANPAGVIVVVGNSFVNCGQNGTGAYTRSISLNDSQHVLIEGNTFIYQTFHEAPAIVSPAAVYLNKSESGHTVTDITIRSNVVQGGAALIAAGNENSTMSRVRVDNPPILKIETKETKELPIWCPPTFIKVESGGEPTAKLPTAGDVTEGQVVTITNSGTEKAKLTSNGGKIGGGTEVTLNAGTALRFMSDGTNWQYA
jgi:hypothetical protein